MPLISDYSEMVHIVSHYVSHPTVIGWEIENKEK